MSNPPKMSLREAFSIVMELAERSMMPEYEDKVWHEKHKTAIAIVTPLQDIGDALGSDEVGANLIDVARASHKAEMELAHAEDKQHLGITSNIMSVNELFNQEFPEKDNDT